MPFFLFCPDFGAGLIAIARGCAPVRLICSCKLRLRRASPTVGLPSGDRALLGLRRLHAGGAKTCSYKVGLEAALIFLEINSENLNASDEELVDLVLKTTAGQVGKREIAEFFRSHCV